MKGNDRSSLDDVLLSVDEEYINPLHEEDEDEKINKDLENDSTFSPLRKLSSMSHVSSVGSGRKSSLELEDREEIELDLNPGTFWGYSENRKLVRTILKSLLGFFCLLLIVVGINIYIRLDNNNGGNDSSSDQLENTDVKPHVVFLFVDDFGWFDIGWNQNESVYWPIKTPFIDSLANEGVLFTNYYVHPMCSPSRGALMTGKYPHKVGLQSWVIGSNQPYSLPLTETIIPQYLKQGNYDTHIIGKWHLGMYKWEVTPMFRGFDSFFGYLLGYGDYWNHTSTEWLDPGTNNAAGDTDPGYDFWDNTTNIGERLEGNYSTWEYVNRAQNIIKQHNKSKSLFLYLPMQATHAPMEVPTYYSDLYSEIKYDIDRKIFSGIASTLDVAVKNITDALKSEGLWNNTVFIFSSDNGGEEKASGYNWPLRGQKTTLWEGGTRANMFVISPLLEKTGYKNDQLIIVEDWLPTILNIAGLESLIEDKEIDGINQWPVILNGTKTKRDTFYYNINEPFNCYGVKYKDWKLVINGSCGQQDHNGWFLPNGSFIEEPPQPEYKELLLFNLTEDPREMTDLADEYPDIVTDLMLLIEEQIELAVPALWYTEAQIEANPIFNEGLWRPWYNYTQNVTANSTVPVGTPPPPPAPPGPPEPTPDPSSGPTIPPT